jgi:hypothetical protein
VTKTTSRLIIDPTIPSNIPHLQKTQKTKHKIPTKPPKQVTDRFQKTKQTEKQSITLVQNRISIPNFPT